MHATISPRWQQGLSLGLGLPLLLGLDPATAADTADQTATGITTGLGLFAALWAVVGVGGAPVGAGGVVAAASGVAALASAIWLWRVQRARFGESRLAVRRGRVGARSSPTSSTSPATSPATAVPARKPVSVPAGFDCDVVLDAARTRFLRLQAAWDAADVATLQSLTTPDMLDELMHVLAARIAGPSRTDVISLHAELLGLEELSAVYIASVEFSGVIRESAEQGSVPFRELWMLASTKEDPPAWKLARQQSLF